MLTTIEAEIDINGQVRLLEPLKLTKKSRVLLTVLEEEPGPHRENALPQRQGGLRELFGTWGSGDPHSAANETIDADLARAYADTHEDE